MVGVTSGSLNVTSPEVSVDTEFDFNFVSNITNGLNQVQVPKLIRLKILNCIVNNWRIWSNYSTSVCVVWDSGYNLYWIFLNKYKLSNIHVIQVTKIEIILIQSLILAIFYLILDNQKLESWLLILR